MQLVPQVGQWRRRYVGLDTETFRFAPDNPAPPIVCAQMYVPGHEPFVVLRKDAFPFVKSFLESALKHRVTVVAHNAHYDFTCLWRTFPELGDLIWALYTQGLVECTLLREKLDDIARGRYLNKTKMRLINGKLVGYALDACIQTRLGITIPKDEEMRLTFNTVDNMPFHLWEPERYKYTRDDPMHAHHMAIIQDEMDRRDPPAPGYYTFKDAAQQSYSAWCLALAAWVGIRTDRKHVAVLEGRIRERLAVHEQKLIDDKLLRKASETKHRDGTRTINPPSQDMKFLKNIIQEVCFRNNLPIRRCKPKNKDDHRPEHERGISTDEEALEIYAPHDMRLTGLSDYKKAKKIKGYVGALSDGFDRPIHSRPNALVANGRVSWGSPNLTNMPQEPGIRESYIPPPGYVFGTIDYSQLELCTLAQMCIHKVGYSRMGELINAGVDLHDTLASSYLRMDVLEFKAHKGEDSFDLIRKAAKIGNFGFAGGMGIDKFMSNNRKAIAAARMTRADVVRLRDTWFLTFPEMKPYFQLASHIAKNKKLIIQEVTHRIRGGVGFCDTANGYFSGLAADGAKRAMCEIQRECWATRSSPAFGAYLVAFVHDEFVLCLPRARASNILDYLYEIAMTVMRAFVPAITGLKGSRALMNRWRKHASEWRVSGELRPYEESPAFAARLAKGEEWQDDDDLILDDDEAEGEFSDRDAEPFLLDSGSNLVLPSLYAPTAQPSLVVPGSWHPDIRNLGLPR